MPQHSLPIRNSGDEASNTWPKLPQPLGPIPRPMGTRGRGADSTGWFAQDQPTPATPRAVNAPQAHPFIKMPRDQPGITQAQQQEQLYKKGLLFQQLDPPRRGKGSSKSVRFSPSPRQAVRQSKSRLVERAWRIFNNEVFDIHNEGGGEDDPELHGLMENMLNMMWDHIHQKGVVPLIELASREEY
ncbi:hypothetical protein G7054_g12065 [Neopestalotiopsis clavispora]|nr:hypothetical protein G7054_g12065 [Neopestalotiopsis clavispora]